MSSLQEDMMHACWYPTETNEMGTQTASSFVVVIPLYVSIYDATLAFALLFLFSLWCLVNSDTIN